MPAAPGAAALFATESTATGRVVRGLLGQGAVVAEAEFSSADPGAHEGMMVLLEGLAGALPGPRWPADTARGRPGMAPLDIAPLLLPVPAGGTMHRAPQTLWLLAFGADFYADDRVGQHHLERLGFKRAAVVGWNEAGGDTYVLVSLLRFGAAGAREWATTTADADAAARPTEDTGAVPDIDESRYLVSPQPARDPGTVRRGRAVPPPGRRDGPGVRRRRLPGASDRAGHGAVRPPALSRCQVPGRGGGQAAYRLGRAPHAACRRRTGPGAGRRRRRRRRPASGRPPRRSARAGPGRTRRRRWRRAAVMSAVTKYVPSGRSTVKPGLGAAAGEQVAPGLQVGPEAVVVGVGQPQRDGHRRLERGGVDEGQELLDPQDRRAPAAAARSPSRPSSPVQEKVLPAEEIRRVRSRMPGQRREWACAGSAASVKTRCSYTSSVTANTS